MSTFTMWGRNLLLRSVFTPEDVAALAELEVALTSTVPPANATGGQLVEPEAAEYVRQTYPMGLAYWAPSNFGELYNTTKITFPQITTAWGRIYGWALVDPVSGECLNSGALATPYQGTIGMIPYLDPGTIMLGIYD